MIYLSGFVFLLIVVNVFAFNKSKCAMKNLTLDQIVGDWKYDWKEARLEDAPSEFNNSNNDFMLHIEKDGSNGIQFFPITMGGFDNRLDDDDEEDNVPYFPAYTYTQLDSEKPAELTTEREFGNGDKFYETLIIVELDPLRYMVTYSPLFQAWGLFLRSTVSKLAVREIKKITRKVKCFSEKSKNFLKKIFNMRVRLEISAPKKHPRNRHIRKYEQYYF